MMIQTDYKNITVPLDILILDDSAADIEIIENEMTINHLSFTSHAVNNEKDYRRYLEKTEPDIILSDYNLPSFTGLNAFSIARKLYPKVPFIFISGVMTDEFAAETLRMGVTDCIHKDSIKKLAPVIRRAIIENRDRKALEAMNEALALGEYKYRNLVDNINVGIFGTTVDGTILVANNALVLMSGYDSVQELMTINIKSLYKDNIDREDMINEITREGSIKNRSMWMKKKNGESFYISFTAVGHFDKNGNLETIDGIAEDITERYRTEEHIRAINSEYELIFNSIVSVIIGVSRKDTVTHWNPFAEELFGIPAKNVIGKKISETGLEWAWDRIYIAIAECMTKEVPVRLEDLSFKRKDGRVIILGLTINPLKRNSCDEIEGFILLGKDLTQSRFLESQLVQVRKLEAIGQLAAGVAHEINTPIQYIGDNLHFIRDAFSKLIGMKENLARYLMEYGSDSRESEIIRNFLGNISMESIDYFIGEIPKAIEEALEGAERVAKIVRSMKQFSHPRQEVKQPTDINRAIGSTVIISRNEWKYVADMEERYDPDLPAVPCFEAEFNQVVLNIIMNAADAIKEAIAAGIIRKGLIVISTRLNANWAEVEISDNGKGIPENIQDRIFDLFFTTKDVGQGTGQGLAISHSIITQKHGGSLTFSSVPGRGTKFLIRIPFDDSEH